MKRILAAAVVSAALSAFAGAAQACVDIIAAAPVTRYDFTQPGAVTETLRLTITDTCISSARQGSVTAWLVDRVENGAPLATLGRLPLEVRLGGQNIVHASTADRIRVARFRYPRTGSPVLEQLDIRLPGASTEAVSETRQYDLHWSYVDGRGDTQTATRAVAFALDVVPAFEVQIAGGGREHTMDFGDLSPGALGRVNLRLRATQPFQVSMTSQNAGVMRRSDQCGSVTSERLTPLNSVEYTATLDGQPISLRTPYQNHRPLSARVSSFDNMPFQVRIDPTLDPGAKLAGRYCDVITLQVSPVR